jgi:hypothetical protein
MSSRRRRIVTALVCAGFLAGGVAAVRAQIWRGGYGGYGRRTPPRLATPDTFQGGFNFCRLMFESNRREKQGWRTDYPGADINFSVRLSELTKAPVTMGEDGEPEFVVVQATDDALFQCPFVVMEDGGTV